MNPTRRDVLKYLTGGAAGLAMSSSFGGGLLSSALAGGDSNTAKRPNILMILVDDMGYSDPGCYGGEVQTPHLDALAGHGVRFTQTHNTAKCFPSRACLLTGLYAQQCGMHQAPVSPSPNSVTIGEVLRSVGYRTYMVGKHHGNGNPYTEGWFDHYWGILGGGSGHFKPWQKYDIGHRMKGDTTFAFDDRVEDPYRPEDPDYYSTDTFTDWAIQFLQESKTESNPFLLYLAYTAPHDPIQAWETDIAKYRELYRAGYDTIRKKRYQRQRDEGILDERYPLSKPMHGSWEALSEEQRDAQVERMAVYAAMIDRIDQNVGRLVQTLKDLGEYDNTLILFASDNGCSSSDNWGGEGPIGGPDRFASVTADWANVSNTPFRYYKTDSFEGGTCTPMIAHWPAGLKNPGRISHKRMHFIDIMPTLAELAGATYPAEYDGHAITPPAGESFAHELRDQSRSRTGTLYWEFKHGRAVQTEDWKCVALRKTDWRLFDMHKDRTETTNLAKEYPETVQTLVADWKQWMADSLGCVQ